MHSAYPAPVATSAPSPAPAPTAVPAPNPSSACVRALALLLRIAVLAAVLLGTTLPVARAEDITLSIAPGPIPEDAPRGDSFAWVLEPGASIEDSVVVTNHNPTALQLDLDVKDAVTTSDGNLSLALPEDPDTGIGAWVTLPQDNVEIPAGESVTVPFTVDVPADAAPGDFSGGVVVTYSTPGDTVSVDNRVATRVDVRVPGDLTVSHEISDLQVSLPSTWSLLGPSTATVTYTLTNTGSARIYAQEAITAAGPLGIGALRTDSTLQEVLPDATVERTVQVDARALLWNTIEVDTSSFAVDETPGGTQSLEESRFAAPWMLLIVCALVLTVAIVLGVRLGRRGGTSTVAPAEGTVAPAKAGAAPER
jgi:hypothetical protein